jgi:heme A synthase
MKSDPRRMGTPASPRPSVFSIWPHRLALLLVCATFPLLFIGGLVTSKGAGLAVPDWPTTFGHNMFFYPWSKMVGNIFYEHSHRLVASFVGLVTIAFTVTVWLRVVGQVGCELFDVPATMQRYALPLREVGRTTAPRAYS